MRAGIPPVFELFLIICVNMRKSCFVLWAGIWLGMSACGTRQEAARTDVGVDDVVTRTIEWRPDSVGLLQDLVAAVRYVPLESTPESFLADISKIRVYRDELYIMDDGMRADYGIRVFGPDGAYRRHIGRAGKGPGEVIQIDDFTIRGDRLFIADGHAGKMVVYTLDGQFVEDIPLADADLASFAACDSGFLWTGDIYYRENPENRYGLYKTDDRMQPEWKRGKYDASSTRALLTEVSDSLLIWMQGGSDSVYFYNRQGHLTRCIHFDFPERHRIAYEKRREVRDLPADEKFDYYRIGEWNPAVVGPYLMGQITMPGGEWDVFMADLRDGRIYLDRGRYVVRDQTAGFYPVNDSTFVSWVTPDSETFLEKTEPRIAKLPDDVRKRIFDGDCALVFYTLK